MTLNMQCSIHKTQDKFKSFYLCDSVPLKRIWLCFSWKSQYILAYTKQKRRHATDLFSELKSFNLIRMDHHLLHCPSLLYLICKHTHRRQLPNKIMDSCHSVQQTVQSNIQALKILRIIFFFLLIYFFLYLLVNKDIQSPMRWLYCDILCDSVFHTLPISHKSSPSSHYILLY